MVLAHAWGVVQLVALGSLARTVRVRTVLVGILVGVYVCAPAAVLVQIVWTRPFAALTGSPLRDVVAVASYTVDPVIEELVKVVPLVALAAVPAVRRQWSVTDWVLVGAAIGSGFGLAENLLRFSHLAGRAIAGQDGWVIATSLAAPTVPYPWSAVSSWLPDGVGTGGIFGGGPASTINVHLVWSAVAGLGVALLRRGRAARLAGVLLVVWAAADHAALNAEVVNDPGIAPLLTWPLDVTRHAIGLLPLLVLGVAWWLDRLRADPPGPAVPLLAAERAAPAPMVGLWRAAVARLPWSLLWIDGYCRVRRAHRNTVRSGRDGGLGEVVEELRDRIDAMPARAPGLRLHLPVGWAAPVLAFLRRPETVVWLVLLAPSLVFFVLGGWPWTTWLQRALATPVGFAVVVAAAVGALVWTAWQLVRSVRHWPAALRHPLADVPAIAALRIGVGAGSVTVGLLLLVAVLSGAGADDPVVRNFHVLDALGSALVVAAILLAVAATFWFPPLAMVALAGGGTALVVTSAAAPWAATMVGAGVLGWSGVMLAEASGGAGGPVQGGGSAQGSGSTAHGAERLAQRGFTPEDVARVRGGQQYTQRDGATAYVKETVEGRYDVIVQGERGIVTALRNIRRSAVDRLARNYGWEGWP